MGCYNYICRHVTRGGEGRGHPCNFSKIGKSALKSSWSRDPGAILHSVTNINKFETAFDNPGDIPVSTLTQSLVLADIVDANLYNCLSLD